MVDTKTSSEVRVPARLSRSYGITKKKKYEIKFTNFPKYSVREFWVVNFLLFEDLVKMLSQRSKRVLVAKLIPYLFDSENYKEKCDKIADILCTEEYTEEAEYFDEISNEVPSREVVQP